MAHIDWDSCLPDAPVLGRDARARLDDRTTSVRSLAVSTARVGRPVPHPGGTRGPCLVDDAVTVMASGLAVRFVYSRSPRSWARDDNWLSVDHDHCASHLCCLLVERSCWSDRLDDGGSRRIMGSHGGRSVCRDHAASVGSELCPERHRADVDWYVRLSGLSGLFCLSGLVRHPID